MHIPERIRAERAKPINTKSDPMSHVMESINYLTLASCHPSWDDNIDASYNMTRTRRISTQPAPSNIIRTERAYRTEI